MLACGPQAAPESYSSAAWKRIRSAASRCAWAVASGNWMPWFWPMGRPKTTLSFAYRQALRMNQWPSPMHSAAIRMRSALSPSSRARNPSPSSPIRLPAGTSSPSRKISEV